MKEFAMNGTPVKMWAHMCDATAWQQISNLCSLPFVFHHLALMPDLHGGKGMPIGTVLATRNVVIPNAVGVVCVQLKPISRWRPLNRMF